MVELKRELKMGDTVVFEVKGRNLTYQVCNSHLEGIGCKNDEIFTYLGLDKISFASKYYGYDSSRSGTWPDFQSGDYAAATRVVEALLKLTGQSKSFKAMDILKKFSLSFKAEPQKSFIKAGITDENDILTTDGQKIFLAYLLKKNGEAFKTEVVDVLTADEDKKVA